jgi:hypothetical protein
MMVRLADARLRWAKAAMLGAIVAADLKELAYGR